MMVVKPPRSKVIFTGRGISKKITEDWLMLKSVVKQKAQDSEVSNLSSFRKYKCITSDTENVTGITRLQILIFFISLL
jgi:hypothetical protein